MNGPIADALSRALFHFLWEGALIAVALAAAIYLLRPSSASVRYGLACAAMLAMVATFAITLMWFWPHAALVTIQSSVPRLSLPPSVPFPSPSTMPPSAPSRLNWIVLAWFLGAGLFSLRSLFAWIAAMRLKRAGAFPAAEIWRAKLVQLGERICLSRPVALLESCRTDVPVVVGFLRPAILVPAALFTGFPPDQLELILIHELAHIRRGDYLVNLLQSIVEDVLFYHPAVWWVSSVMRAERENCCDDIVVAETHNARGFAAALAALEQNRWTAHEAALAANGGHLMNRVRRLLEGQDRPRLGFARCAAPVFLAGLLPLMFVIAASVSHAQSPAAALPFPKPPAPRPPVLMAQVQAPQAQPAVPAAPAAAEEETPYKKWLNEDVVYIVSEVERRAFKELNTNDEREKFIEQFWLRRNPDPSSVDNKAREEHYRRLAYANEVFGVKDVPGWKTDRGMIYVKYGPPDEREEHKSGGVYQRPIEEGGGQTSTFPFEKWRYRYLPGLGNDVNIEFVDSTLTGDFHMTTDPAEKDALLYVPHAGLTMYEQMGLASKDDRFTRTDGTHLGTGTMPLPASMDQFTRLEAFATLQAPKPAVPTLVPPEGAIIEDIVFRGARRVAQDVLRNSIKTHPGDKFDKNALDRDMLALWNTKRFTDVRLTFEQGQTGWIVHIDVAETPVLRPN